MSDDGADVATATWCVSDKSTTDLIGDMFRAGNFTLTGLNAQAERLVLEFLLSHHDENPWDKIAMLAVTYFDSDRNTDLHAAVCSVYGVEPEGPRIRAEFSWHPEGIVRDVRARPVSQMWQGSSADRASACLNLIAAQGPQAPTLLRVLGDKDLRPAHDVLLGDFLDAYSAAARPLGEHL